VSAGLLADALVAAHLAFILFALAGGLLALHRRAWAVLHLPAVAWAAYAELTGTTCPLTPWENALRRAAGAAGYGGGFVEHYIIPLLYPQALTARGQAGLGFFLLAVNVAVYVLVWRARRRARSPRRPRRT
jgi:hypothetical protein